MTLPTYLSSGRGVRDHHDAVIRRHHDPLAVRRKRDAVRKDPRVLVEQAECLHKECKYSRFSELGAASTCSARSWGYTRIFTVFFVSNSGLTRESVRVQTCQSNPSSDCFQQTKRPITLNALPQSCSHRTPTTPPPQRTRKKLRSCSPGLRSWRPRS